MSRAAKVSLSAAFILVGLVALLSLRRENLADGVFWLPKCSLHLWTGLYCPGCGNTRATQALLHGDLAGAWRQNAFFVVALPFLLFGAARLWVGWVFPGKLRPLPFAWRYTYSAILIALVVLFGILRNFPQEPFAALAPVPLAGAEVIPDAASETSPETDSPVSAPATETRAAKPGSPPRVAPQP